MSMVFEPFASVLYLIFALVNVYDNWPERPLRVGSPFCTANSTPAVCCVAALMPEAKLPPSETVTS